MFWGTPQKGQPFPVFFFSYVGFSKRGEEVFLNFFFLSGSARYKNQNSIFNFKADIFLWNLQKRKSTLPKVIQHHLDCKVLNLLVWYTFCYLQKINYLVQHLSILHNFQQRFFNISCCNRYWQSFQLSLIICSSRIIFIKCLNGGN